MIQQNENATNIEREQALDFKEFCFVLFSLPILTFISFFIWNADAYFRFYEVDSHQFVTFFYKAVILIAGFLLYFICLNEKTMNKEKFNINITVTTIVAIFTIIPACFYVATPVLWDIAFQLHELFR